jgi:hypothetical protein
MRVMKVKCIYISWGKAWPDIVASRRAITQQETHFQAHPGSFCLQPEDQPD